MTRNRDAYTERVLDLNRATAVLADLNSNAAGLATLYGRALPDNSEDRNPADLADAVDYLLDDARTKWLKGADAGLDRDDADHYRGAAIDRARHLAATAEAAREAAEALALILEGVVAFDTADHLEWLITAAEHNHRAGDKSYDLAELWLRLAQAHHSPAITDAEADQLRCEFDLALARLGGLPDTTGLGAEVHIWRDDYLKYRAGWEDAGTWAYAIGTARAWPELRRYWDTLAEAGPGDGAETFRLRDAVIDRAATLAGQLPATDDDPDRVALLEAVTHYNTDHMALMARIRGAETMADLWHLDGIVDALEGDKLNLESGIARKFDRLKRTASDAGDTDAWAPASRLAAKVARWRQMVHTAALTAGERGADPERTYRLMYTAIADARLWDDPEPHVNELYEVADTLARRGQITPDHLERLRARTTSPTPGTNGN